MLSTDPDYLLSNSQIVARALEESAYYDNTSDPAGNWAKDTSLADRIYKMLQAKHTAQQKMKKAQDRDAWFLTTIKGEIKPLTPEQRAEVEAFWEPYSFAYKNDYRIQEFFSSVSGVFSPAYIGFGLLAYYLNRHWNHNTYLFIRNKNNLDLLFPDIKHAKTILRNVYARWYTPDRRLISEEEAVDLLWEFLNDEDADEVILKPDDEGEGRGIHFLKPGATKEEIEGAFKEQVNKFLVQAIQKEHESLAKPHPESLNTLRIVTYMVGSTVKHIGTIWRMGVGESRIDNIADGNLACEVYDDGTCASIAHDDFGGVYDKHPSGFVFEGHRIEHYDKALECAMRAHSMIPQIKIVSWDIIIDEEGDPLIMEVNIPGGLVGIQSTGKLFLGGDIETTKKVLDTFLHVGFYQDLCTWDWDYREYYDHVTILKYAGKKPDAFIPTHLNGKPVTAIARVSFDETGVTSITYSDKAAKELVVPIENIGKRLNVPIHVSTEGSMEDANPDEETAGEATSEAAVSDEDVVVDATSQDAGSDDASCPSDKAEL